MKKFVLILMALTVYILHQDFWLWTEHKPLVFGFIPIGLAYHAGFSMLCALMMFVLVKYAWPSELEHVEPAPQQNPDGEAAP